MDVKQDQIDAARRELHEFNDSTRTLESCVMDMRLQYERLEKNMAEANQEIAVTNNLIAAQRITIEKQKKQLEKYELIY